MTRGQQYDETIRLNPTLEAAWTGRCWRRAIVGEMQAALADCNEPLRFDPIWVCGPTSVGLQLGDCCLQPLPLDWPPRLERWLSIVRSTF